ncbi:ClpXP protease specificity-enhancing factor [Roseateles toxinivorans]|uniref:Stringent starvation protein B n=1 Tax=Roseateles toxinivorans TaxID=270368 RepID=A0A4R6QJ25_9BURK|nr:ClpXP protease specificity-enhancing factor [Roseateles toxinivorans]TDP63384.1 stringent starvation protein B [Roseateles toxinivorans]
MDSSNDNTKGQQGTSTRPYLIRALHDWCTDNGFTPYLAVQVGRNVQVPMEYVNNNEIVLNVGFEATSGLKLGNEFVEFKARFGGVSREISVPVEFVLAIYARENGQGMAFPAPQADAGEPATGPSLASVPDSEAPAEGSGSRPPTPLRGLRLAGADSAKGEAEHAVPPPADPGPDGDGPAPAGPGRPALKRVK